MMPRRAQRCRAAIVGWDRRRSTSGGRFVIAPAARLSLSAVSGFDSSCALSSILAGTQVATLEPVEAATHGAADAAKGTLVARAHRSQSVALRRRRLQRDPSPRRDALRPPATIQLAGGRHDGRHRKNHVRSRNVRRSREVLYLSAGDRREAAESLGTPEGHVVRYDAAGKVIGITIIDARWLLDRDGKISITIPERKRASP